MKLKIKIFEQLKQFQLIDEIIQEILNCGEFSNKI